MFLKSCVPLIILFFIGCQQSQPNRVEVQRTGLIIAQYADGESYRLEELWRFSTYPDAAGPAFSSSVQTASSWQKRLRVLVIKLTAPVFAYGHIVQDEMGYAFSGRVVWGKPLSEPDTVPGEYFFEPSDPWGGAYVPSDDPQRPGQVRWWGDFPDLGDFGAFGFSVTPGEVHSIEFGERRDVNDVRFRHFWCQYPLVDSTSRCYPLDEMWTNPEYFKCFAWQGEGVIQTKPVGQDKPCRGNAWPFFTFHPTADETGAPKQLPDAWWEVQ